jgi:hypothetical protein
LTPAKWRESIIKDDLSLLSNATADGTTRHRLIAYNSISGRHHCHYLFEGMSLNRSTARVIIVRPDGTATVSDICVVTHHYTFVQTFGWIVIEPDVIAESVQQQWGHL